MESPPSPISVQGFSPMQETRSSNSGHSDTFSSNDSFEQTGEDDQSRPSPSGVTPKAKPRKTTLSSVNKTVTMHEMVNRVVTVHSKVSNTVPGSASQLTPDDSSDLTHQMPVRENSGFQAPPKSWIRPGFLERVEDVDGHTRLKSSFVGESPIIPLPAPGKSTIVGESPKSSLPAGSPSTPTCWQSKDLVAQPVSPNIGPRAGSPSTSARYAPSGTQMMMKEWLQKVEQKEEGGQSSPSIPRPRSSGTRGPVETAGRSLGSRLGRMSSPGQDPQP
eukprot:gene21466-28439_t